MRPNILIIIPSLIPSVVIGVIRPLVFLAHHSEISIRIRHSRFHKPSSSDFDWCDIGIFCRSCEITDLNYLYQLRLRDKKVIYEIDDNFEEIPLSSLVGVYHRAFFRLHVVKRFYNMSDITRVYSPIMAKQVNSRNGNAFLIQSYFDTDIIDGLSANRHNNRIKLVYATGRTDDVELEKCLFKSVINILRRYPDKVEFHIWREQVPPLLANVRGVVLKKGIRNYEKFIRTFYQEGYHIGLAPGFDHPFFQSKTNNKYRELGGCGIAGIYSNVAPYKDCIINNCNGLLVGPTSEDWTNAIEYLVNDHDARKRIASNASIDIKEKYSFDNAVDDWRIAIKRVISEKVIQTSFFADRHSRRYIALVCLSNSSDRRVSHFMKAVNTLSYARRKVVFQNGTTLFDSFIKGSLPDYLFILANCRRDLIDLLPCMGLIQKIAIDISCYNNDLEDISDTIEDIGRRFKGISWIINPKQRIALNRFLSDQPNKILVEVNRNSSFTIQEYSVDGYPAIYLDLCENPIFLTSSRSKNLLVTKLFSKLLCLCQLYLRKISSYLSWLHLLLTH
jgi:hypothetical protein